MKVSINKDYIQIINSNGHKQKYHYFCLYENKNIVVYRLKRKKFFSKPEFNVIEQIFEKEKFKSYLSNHVKYEMNENQLIINLKEENKYVFKKDAVDAIECFKILLKLSGGIK